jgi:GT2 family glycosyltransferase
MAYTTNQGMQRSQNILLDRASGDYLCLIGNDILLPPNWLSELVRYNQAIADSGISGIHCVMHKPEITFYKGMKVRRNDTVFGTMFFNRRFFNKVGYINESFHPYGMDDSELSYRSRKAGYVNYYLPNLTSEHIGHDVGEQSDYRRMKDIALTKSEQIYKSVTEQIDLTGQYYYKP